MSLGLNAALQYVPFCSSISSTFWDVFTKLKLNDLQLSTEPISIHGNYSRRIVEGIPPILELQHDAFQLQYKPLLGEIAALGTLINTNTIEEFKKKDKSELLQSVATRLWDAIVSGEAVVNPTILSSFLIFIFADLKNYHFYHWLAFPVFTIPANTKLLSELQTLENNIKNKKIIDLLFSALQEYDRDLNYFVVQIIGENIQILPLSHYLDSKMSENENCKVMLGFSDPSNDKNYPGWPLRNLLTLALVKWSSSIEKHTIFSLREKITSGVASINQSLVFDIEIKSDIQEFNNMPPCLGWEKNERKKLGPKFTNLKFNMEPERIAESAVELNLKLMRWRLVPELDLNAIKNCHCLLIGAGTLGSNVARCLLGWGVQNITFVDCGTVSFSNPVRQSLYLFEDCLGTGKPKAEAAAAALKKIYPSVNSIGVNMTIPMPGHTVGPSQVEQVTQDVLKLEKLVDDHDAIFLLTDSRESRWLLTVLGAAKQKIVLTSALGFDSFVVLRHGIRPESPKEEEDNNKVVGCYFCNDVVAPRNSISDRTLDQQCTVTRPGISYMAAGHIVELLVSLLHHPLKGRAPPSDKEESTVLGAVPHSIRYYFSRLHTLITSTIAFKNCSACGPRVINAYKENGIDFLFKVFNSTKYLEDISGLTTLHQEQPGMEIWEISDDEDDE